MSIAKVKSMPCLLYGVRTAYTVMRSLALYTVLSDLMETAQYRRNFIAQRVKERGARVEWNKKLAAEYRQSALKIKGRIDELTAQVRAHRGPHGVLDKEGDEILIRRRFLYHMYADTVCTAHLLEHYYD